MKSFAVEAYFPEVKPAHCAFHSVVVRVSGMSVAARVAIEEIRRRPEMRGKRVTIAKLTISEVRSVTSREQ